jgi:hypothetical protein
VQSAYTHYQKNCRRHGACAISTQMVKMLYEAPKPSFRISPVTVEPFPAARYTAHVCSKFFPASASVPAHSGSASRVRKIRGRPGAGGKGGDGGRSRHQPAQEGEKVSLLRKSAAVMHHAQNMDAPVADGVYQRIRSVVDAAFPCTRHPARFAGILPGLPASGNRVRCSGAFMARCTNLSNLAKGSPCADR